MFRNSQTTLTYTYVTHVVDEVLLKLKHVHFLNRCATHFMPLINAKLSIFCVIKANASNDILNSFSFKLLAFC